MQIMLCSDDVFLPDTFYDSEKIVKRGDVVIAASTGSETLIGKPGFAYDDFDKVQIGAFLQIIRPDVMGSVGYIRVIIESDIYRIHIRESAKGTNINNIKAEYINDFAVPIPPLDEQSRIATAVENAFVELDKVVENLS